MQINMEEYITLFWCYWC